MGKYKISELAQLWGCSVPTVHKRVEKEGYKTIQAPDEQNKMVKYVIIDDDLQPLVKKVENVVNDAEVIEIPPVFFDDEETKVDKFVSALMSLTKEHEKTLEQKNNELVQYKASALLLEDKKYSEGLLIDNNKELQQKNRELEREQKNLQKMNEYLKYAIFASIVIIVGLLVFIVR